MSNEPKRRNNSALTSQPETSIWSTIARYATEIAPVAGPLLEAIGQTAQAIDRAEIQSRSLPAVWEELEE